MKRTAIVILLMLPCLSLLGCNSTTEYTAATGAMEPTIKEGERIGVNSAAYAKAGDIRRWEIVVYSRTEGGLTPKRVVGLPGERLEWSQGLKIDGEAVEVPDYLKEVLKDFTGPHGGESGECDIPNDAVFVIGDRLAASKDSRYDGPVKFADIKGKVVSISGKPVK
jgi:signal peptidase I